MTPEELGWKDVQKEVTALEEWVLVLIDDYSDPQGIFIWETLKKAYPDTKVPEKLRALPARLFHEKVNDEGFRETRWGHYVSAAGYILPSGVFTNVTHWRPIELYLPTETEHKTAFEAERS